MKKTILVLLSILFFVYVFFSLLALRSDYNAERELWRINRTLNYVSTHVESTPDFTMDQLVRRYRSFTTKYSTSPYAKSAQLMLGDLYELRKNYTQARLEYQKAIGRDDELSAQAEFTIAKTYEVEGHWDMALPIYKSISQQYPVTTSGFYAPMYLANHVVSSGDDQREYTAEAYTNALAFYKKVAAKHPKSKIEFDALRMVAVCELNLKDWTGTVNTMGELILKYPVGSALKEALKAINLICVTKLHNYDMGINIYTEFIQKYPNNSIDPLLKQMIKDLQILKNKNLIIRATPPKHKL
jgi:tetratricopeptide (TPR) repeat protein